MGFFSHLLNLIINEYLFYFSPENKVFYWVLHSFAPYWLYQDAPATLSWNRAFQSTLILLMWSVSIISKEIDSKSLLRFGQGSNLLDLQSKGEHSSSEPLGLFPENRHIIISIVVWILSTIYSSAVGMYVLSNYKFLYQLNKPNKFGFQMQINCLASLYLPLRHFGPTLPAGQEQEVLLTPSIQTPSPHIIALQSSGFTSQLRPI